MQLLWNADLKLRDPTKCHTGRPCLQEGKGEPRWVVRETIQTKRRLGYKETVTLKIEQQKKDPTTEEKQHQRSRVQENMQIQISKWEQRTATDQDLVRATQEYMAMYNTEGVSLPKEERVLIKKVGRTMVEFIQS